MFLNTAPIPMILHTVNQSPFDKQTLVHCLNRCGEDDSILLIENGVYAALTDGVFSKLLSGAAIQTVYALEEDVLARGLGSKILPTIKLIDYAQFVQLCTEHALVQSWF